jgi:signal transduction histidine kinase
MESLEPNAADGRAQNLALSEADRLRRNESLERTMRALRDAREAHDMLAIVSRGIGRDFHRTCVAYELRDREFKPVAASRSGALRSPRSLEEIDLDVLRLRAVMRVGAEDLLAVSFDGQLRAMLVIEDATQPLGEEDVKHLRALAGQLSLGLASALAFEQLRRYAAEGAALVDAARTILGVNELEPLARVLCGLVMRMVFASYACVYGHRGEVLARIGYAVAEGSALPPEELPADETAAGAVLQSEMGMSFATSRLMMRADPAVEAQPGFLVLGRTDRFSKSERRLIDSLVTLAALAIRNVELYEQTARTSQALAESNAFKDDLMAMFAHDFRGPLTVISGFSELLLESEDAAARTCAETIIEQTKRLAKLSEDALALAATQSAGFSLQRASEDLAAFVREAIAPLDRERRVTIEMPAEPVVVSFDRGRLRHVIDNVVGNALKYSTGTVAVRVAPGDVNVSIEVADSGIGIPEGEVQQVFTRFGRGTNARSRGIAGSGVGLYVAKKIVDVHGGRLLVRSVENQGSTFSIILPV